jgi:hypothetical protein
MRARSKLLVDIGENNQKLFGIGIGLEKKMVRVLDDNRFSPYHLMQHRKINPSQGSSPVSSPYFISIAGISTTISSALGLASAAVGNET